MGRIFGMEEPPGARASRHFERIQSESELLRFGERFAVRADVRVGEDGAASVVILYREETLDIFRVVFLLHTSHD
jgi:hypothetical protein